MDTKFKHIPEEAMSEPRNPTSMLNITNDQCKYPLWGEKDREGLLCGRKRHGKYSYCAYHLYLTTKHD
jgi:hypothetical protein